MSDTLKTWKTKKAILVGLYKEPKLYSENDVYYQDIMLLDDNFNVIKSKSFRVSKKGDALLESICSNSAITGNILGIFSHRELKSATDYIFKNLEFQNIVRLNNFIIRGIAVIILMYGEEVLAIGSHDTATWININNPYDVFSDVKKFEQEYCKKDVDKIMKEAVSKTDEAFETLSNMTQFLNGDTCKKIGEIIEEYKNLNMLDNIDYFKLQN